MQNLLERVYFLMKERDTNAKKVTTELGISASTFTDWKKQKCKPTLEIIVKIADYFNVSIDWLVSGTINQTISDPEQKLLSNYRSLDSKLQDNLLSYSDGLVQAYKLMED